MCMQICVLNTQSPQICVNSQPDGSVGLLSGHGFQEAASRVGAQF